MRTQKAITFVLILQLIILAGQWLGTPRTLATADAQVTDPGRDRLQIIDALRGIDTKMDRLNELLASGKLQVRVAAADEAKGSR